MTLDPGLFGLMLEKMVGMLGEMQKGLNVKGVTKRNGGEKSSVDLSPMNEEWTRVRGKRPKVVKRKSEPAQALNSFSGLKEVRCDGKAATNFEKVGSNGLGAFGSCPIPDVNFLFIFFFFFNRPKGRQ